MKNPWTIVGILAVVLIGGSIWYSGAAAEKNNEGVAFTPHTKGNSEATVTLVEYSDFQCPACAAFQQILSEVLAEYGDSLRFEYKHFPLPIHKFAEPAARAAEAAGQQDAFFPFHDLLFENQQTWTRSANPTAQFLEYAEQLGLDITLFKKHMNASLVREKVQTEAKEARALGLTGTPTFFLNDERMVFSTYDEFRNQIIAAVNPEVTFGADGAPAAAPVTPAVQFGI